MRVDVAEIALGLWVHQRVAIYLRSRGLEYFGIAPAREFQKVQRTEHACLERMDRISLVVPRRGRAGKIVDLVDLKAGRQRIDDVVFDASESGIAQKGVEIVSLAGVEIIQRDDVIPVPQQAFTQMRPQEACAPGNQGATSFLVRLPLTDPGSQLQNLDDLAHGSFARRR